MSTTRNPGSIQMISRRTRQFFIQNEWRSERSKTNSIPSRRPTDSRNMYPRARDASSTATSRENSSPPGRTATAQRGAGGPGESVDATTSQEKPTTRSAHARRQARGRGWRSPRRTRRSWRTDCTNERRPIRRAASAEIPLTSLERRSIIRPSPSIQEPRPPDRRRALLRAWDCHSR